MASLGSSFKNLDDSCCNCSVTNVKDRSLSESLSETPTQRHPIKESNTSSGISSSSSSRIGSSSSLISSEDVAQITDETEDKKKGSDGTDEPDYTQVYKPTTEPLKPKDGNYVGCCSRLLASVVECFTCASCKGFSRRHIILLIILCLGTLTSSFAVCLFPPFFPKIAEEKGATATIFGLIIGTNCLVAFLVTPFIGKKLEVIGVKFAFVSGMFCSGGCCMLSGYLEFFPPGKVFIVIAVMIRVLHATANAGVITATFAFIAVEFPASMAKMFALTRMMMNIAQMFGPVVGGGLYEVGGFKMPFVVLGCIQLFTSAICLFLLPPYVSPKGSSKSNRPEGKTVWSIVRVPGMWVSFVTFVFATMSNGFLSITLEPLVLRQFSLSPFYVGLLFGLKDGANSLASPIWGWLCDRSDAVRCYIILGSVFAGSSFVLIGPFPGLHLELTLWMVILALTLNGIGIGGQQVAGVVNAMKEAVNAGFSDSASTHGFVAGLWSSLSGAGRFISRSSSGALVDNIGFKNSSVIVVALHCAVLLVTITFSAIKGSCDKAKEMNNQSALTSNTYARGNDDQLHNIYDTYTPSEPVTVKNVEVNIPSIRDDLEDSFSIGSAPESSYMRRRPSRSRDIP